MTSLGSAVEQLFIAQLFSFLRPVERLSTREHAERYRNLGNEVTAFPGKYDALRVPHMLQVMASFDDPSVPVIVSRKSAQIAWSETQNCYIARIIHQDPQNIIMAFPRRDSGKDYADEKIRPLIKSTPELMELIGDPEKCLWSRYKYPGGFLKMITAGSVSAMKSTSAPIIIVEEPDDLSADIKSQGDALEILKERQKTFAERKLIYGGTPTDAGFSNVEAAYAKSNKFKFSAICHSCGDRHIIGFEHLHRETWSDRPQDEIYGKYDPASAYYVCPNCNTEWSFEQKNENILTTALNTDWYGWKPEKPEIIDIHGFAFNELLSPFPASSYQKLAEKLCVAEVALAQGNEGKMKSFVNNQIGRAYSRKLENLDEKQLKLRALDYPERIVPEGGLVLTMGVDVQLNRLAIVIRAWGRNGNSWLVWFGEIFGDTTERDSAVWQQWEQICRETVPTTYSTEGTVINLPISAVSIDSSDNTEVVYYQVKKANRAGLTVFATKGSSDIGIADKPIFNAPSDPEAASGKSSRKALWERMGVNLYIVGTQSAKDEVLRRAGLTGDNDRLFVYKGVRNDYFKQLLSNVKQTSGNRTKYKLKPGYRDEVLDCECLALHATYAIGMPSWDAVHWQQIEQSLVKRSAADKYLKPSTPTNVTPGVN